MKLAYTGSFFILYGSNDWYFIFRQQWLSEKESAEKLKSYSQQQAKRATNAEVSTSIVNM
jgi:hypothetical protein